MRLTLDGIKKIIAKVMPPRIVSTGLIFVSSRGRFCTIPSTPPLGLGCPTKGAICSKIRMTPIPDMKPEITL